MASADLLGLSAANQEPEPLLPGFEAGDVRAGLAVQASSADWEQEAVIPGLEEALIAGLEEEEEDQEVPGHGPCPENLWEDCPTLVDEGACHASQPRRLQVSPGLPTQHPGAAAQLPATLAGAETDAAASTHRFLLRCVGRWRIRVAPQLHAGVVGTLGPGCMMVASPVNERPSKHRPQTDTGEGDGTELDHGRRLVTSQWLRILRFEGGQSPGLVQLRRQGTELFVYRRNKAGHGLYELGVEPQNGELLNAAGEPPRQQPEDTTMTWKLLGAAEQVGRLLSDWSLPTKGPSWMCFDATCNAGGPPAQEKSPEKQFERRQRAQLQAAAKGAMTQLTALVELLEEWAPCDTGQRADTRCLELPRELPSKFGRLVSLLELAEVGPRGSTAAANEAIVEAIQISAARPGMDEPVDLDEGGLPESCAEAKEVLERAWACKRAESRVFKELFLACTALQKDLEQAGQRLKQERRTAELRTVRLSPGGSEDVALTPLLDILGPVEVAPPPLDILGPVIPVALVFDPEDDPVDDADYDNVVRV